MLSLMGYNGFSAEENPSEGLVNLDDFLLAKQSWSSLDSLSFGPVPSAQHQWEKITPFPWSVSDILPLGTKFDERLDTEHHHPTFQSFKAHPITCYKDGPLLKDQPPCGRIQFSDGSSYPFMETQRTFFEPILCQLLLKCPRSE